MNICIEYIYRICIEYILLTSDEMLNTSELFRKKKASKFICFRVACFEILRSLPDSTLLAIELNILYSIHDIYIYIYINMIYAC